MVEAEFFLELLMSLLADPARLDGRGERLQIGFGGEVGQIVFLLAGRAPLADEPGFFPGHMLHALVADALRRPVGDAHADGGEGGGQRPLGSLTPTDASPLCGGENVFGRRDVADGLQEPAIVEPVHPLEGRELDGLEVPPGPTTMNCPSSDDLRQFWLLPKGRLWTI